MRARGMSLVELVIVMGMVGLLTLVSAPRLARWRDRHAVHRAVYELAALHDRARFAAIARATRVRLELSAAEVRAVYEGATDSLAFVWPGPARHGVQARFSRTVLRVGPLGLGLGGSNTKVVLWRGAAAESLTTSRLGRLKRW